MRRPYIKVQLLVCLLVFSGFAWVYAQQAQTQELPAIKLAEPNKKGGLPAMEALSIRASVGGWSDKELSPQDLSDLLWAANGINRPDIKKRTAASAMNAQDVDIYVFMKTGVYIYDAANHALNPVVSGDHREEIRMAPGGARPGGPPAGAPPGRPAGAPPAGAPGRGPGAQGSPAPVNLILISDTSRFGAGTPELKYEWGAIDTGIVSQNIALFCAAKGLGTRPRASISKDTLRKLLKLKDTQFPFLEHPVGYLAAPASQK
jgi:nitroreductase